MQNPTCPAEPRDTPGGSAVAMGKSDTMGTSPSKMAADTDLACFRLLMAQLCSAAHASTEKRRLMSVAVVMTAVASSAPAMACARALAPPMCPDRMGMTNLPSSSTTITAGS